MLKQMPRCGSGRRSKRVQTQKFHEKAVSWSPVGSGSVPPNPSAAHNPSAEGSPAMARRSSPARHRARVGADISATPYTAWAQMVVATLRRRSCDDGAKAAFESVWSGVIVLTRSPGGGRTGSAAALLGCDCGRYGE